MGVTSLDVMNSIFNITEKKSIFIILFALVFFVIKIQQTECGT